MDLPEVVGFSRSRAFSRSATSVGTLTRRLLYRSALFHSITERLCRAAGQLGAVQRDRGHTADRSVEQLRKSAQWVAHRIGELINVVATTKTIAA